MEIRPFKAENAEEVALVIAETLRESNSKDYTADYIENCIASHSAEVILKRATAGHMYVTCDRSRIIGCGEIASYWGSLTESVLLTIFVLPDYQGKGIGRRIIEMLERDEYFLRTKRIEIPASKTAVPFYKKMGYDYKNNIAEPDDEGLFRLEKFRL